MKIQEFVEGRNINAGTVRKYIQRNPDKFNGHIGRPNNINLDEIAIQLLEEKYPFPQPIEVIQDTAAIKDLQEELIEVNRKLRDLYEENRELMQYEIKYRALETQQLQLIEQAVNEKEQEITSEFQKQLEAKNFELKQLQTEKADWVSIFKDREREVVQLQLKMKDEQEQHLQQINELNDALEKEKNKSWWQKLRGK